MCDFSVSRLLAAALVCTATAAAAQNGNSNKENDPYSRYGLGQPLSGTWPGWASTRAIQARMAGYFSSDISPSSQQCV